VRVEALQVPVDIFCAGSHAEELADRVRDAWDWCLLEPGRDAPARASQRLTVVVEDGTDSTPDEAGETVVRGPTVAAAMDRLSPVLTDRVLTERRTDLVMFHACAVADPVTGDAVALYGPSGTGKTTLARTLCSDLVYLSDEAAGISDELRLVPYPKPLSIIVASGDELKDQVSPGRLGLVRPAGQTFLLRALVQLRRGPDHVGEATLDRLATVDALPELVAQTSFTRDMHRPLHRLADLAHRVGGVRRATYAEAAQLRPVVRALLDGDDG
jgi:hypothetical protein